MKRPVSCGQIIGHPFMEGVSEVVVDKDVAEGRKEPIRAVDGKKKKEQAA